MLYYSLGLLLVFYVLLCLEVFLPSGGLLGVGAGLAAIAAIVIAFNQSLLAGATVSVFVAATTPPAIWGLLKVWPHTPIGRRMLNRSAGDRAKVPEKTTVDGTPIDSLQGRVGVALSNLLPSGRVLIDDKKLDAVSIGMPIDTGDEVIVTSVEAGRIHVRKVTDQDRNPPEDAPPQSPPSLEGSLESLDFE
jgi:membrane-bound ClpP family serine protease